MEKESMSRGKNYTNKTLKTAARGLSRETLLYDVLLRKNKMLANTLLQIKI